MAKTTNELLADEITRQESLILRRAAVSIVKARMVPDLTQLVADATAGAALPDFLTAHTAAIAALDVAALTAVLETS